MILSFVNTYSFQNWSFLFHYYHLTHTEFHFKFKRNCTGLILFTVQVKNSKIKFYWKNKMYRLDNQCLLSIELKRSVKVKAMYGQQQKTLERMNYLKHWQGLGHHQLDHVPHTHHLVAPTAVHTHTHTHDIAPCLVTVIEIYRTNLRISTSRVWKKTSTHHFIIIFTFHWFIFLKWKMLNGHRRQRWVSSQFEIPMIYYYHAVAKRQCYFIS